MSSSAGIDQRPQTTGFTGRAVDLSLLLVASALGTAIIFLSVLPALVTGPGTPWDLIVENSIFFAATTVLAWIGGCVPFGIHAAITKFRSERQIALQYAGIATVQALTAGMSPIVVDFASGYIPMIGPFVGIGYAFVIPATFGSVIPISLWAFKQDFVR